MAYSYTRTPGILRTKPPHYEFPVGTAAKKRGNKQCESVACVVIFSLFVRIWSGRFFVPLPYTFRARPEWPGGSPAYRSCSWDMHESVSSVQKWLAKKGESHSLGISQLPPDPICLAQPSPSTYVGIFYLIMYGVLRSDLCSIVLRFLKF